MEAFYTPAIEEKKPFVEGLETIPVRLKEEAIVKHLSQTIYSSWKSALRELYANELTAAKKAARMGSRPAIEITLDPKTRMLTIHGKDSLGITGEKFKVLRYYGRSGNFSGEDAGQFGFGFKSYVGIAEEVRVETFARETGEKYGFIGTGGIEFRELPDEELTIDSHGTKVSLVIRGGKEEERDDDDADAERERIKLTDVVETFEEVCRFAEIDTYLVLPSPIKTKSKYSWSDRDYWHTEKEAGRNKLNRTPAEYVREVHGKEGYDFELDSEDFHFYGYLAIDSDGEVGFGYNDRDKEIRLVGMPIKATIRNRDAKEGDTKNPQIEPSYPLTFWVVNLKDERKFMPTADRERLKEGFFDRVHEQVARFLKGEFAKMEVRSFDDYRNSPYKPVLDTVSWGSPYADYFTEPTKHVCTILGTKVGGVSEEGQEQDRWRRSSWGVPSGAYEAKLRDFVAKSKHLFMLPRKRKGNGFVFPLGTVKTLRKVLRTKYPDAEVFLHPGFEHYWGQSDLVAAEKRQTMLMEQFGVLEARTEAKKVSGALGKDWRKAAGVEVKGKETPEDVVVWGRTHDYNRVEPVRKSIKDVGATTVRVRGNIKEWVSLLREHHVYAYSFTKDIPGIVGGMTEEEFAEEVSSTEVQTIEGKTTIGAAASRDEKPITVFRFDDPEILRLYRPKGRKVVLVPSDESAFGTTAYLRLTNRDFSVVKSVEESLLKEPIEPVSTQNPAETNYLYIAQRHLGRSADRTLTELLRNALSNSEYDGGTMKSLVDTATKYSRYLS